MEIFGASFINAQMLWLLGRAPVLPKTTIKTLKERIKSLGLNPGHLMKHDQENCPLKTPSFTSHQRTSRQGYGWNVDGSMSRFPLSIQVDKYPPNLFSANFLKEVQYGKLRRRTL
ncbi:hypothetical protein RvY_08882 [Ramazzottius varieornatus]|uniref:Uncharacterized protein n=1 Tax=Ramazzottius varieornatus TaxID=947166 RepID=A0A1D1V7I4_RAMVA|nr:hypothetical protein RvY_08882 [Ramazzottius varieornatus]